jgi:hypothetical protein
MERDAHLQSLFYLSSRVPSKRTLPPGSLHSVPREREICPTSRASFNHLSKSALGKPTPGCPTVPMKTDADLQSLFFIPYRVPSKGAPPPGSLNPFSGGFFNTMSYLPGKVLNFKIPRARPFYSGYRKKK